MKPKDLEVLKSVAEFEASHPEREYPLGWSWRQVRVWPATLNRLVVEGLVEVTFSSNSYTGYRLTEKAKALAQGGEPEVAPEIPSGPPGLPDDLFQDIIGHDEVKELLRACLRAERPVHVLLCGPPALAKSLFLWELERAGTHEAGGPRALWILGSASSRAGLQEVLLERRPWLLLIDELDKLDGRDQGALLSAMEGGRIARAKVGKMADEVSEVRVVAAANTTSRLAPELLSRFALRRLHPYGSEEFQQVVVGLLQRRESCDEALAREIAERLDGRTQDVRDAVRVARLAPQLGAAKAVELLLGGAT